MQRQKLKNPKGPPSVADNHPLTDPEKPPCVINLSSKILTEGHFGIFEKGPKFVPTPFKANFQEFMQDFTLWKNKVRWAYYHANKSNEDNNEAVAEAEGMDDEDHRNMERALIKTKKSQYMAPINKNYALELFLHKLDEEIKHHKEKAYVGDNLTKEERQALREMMKWTDVIIRPFDKGTGYIIDDREAYINRIMREIKDEAVYEIIEDKDNAIEGIHTRIEDWVEKYTDDISPKIATWIVDKDANFGYFYQNYKAHKPDKGYPGRTITSGCGSPTERLSEWLEYILSKLMDKLLYRLKDTNDVHKKIKEFNSQENKTANIIHAAWDIEAMFPNINNQMGMEACRVYLDARTKKKPSTQCILDALLITLEENVAEFNGVVVRQKKGTAMGPHHSCSYGDITIDRMIDQLVMGETNNFKDCIGFWSRLRDDIYCPWMGSEEDLLAFDRWLNALDPDLNFTLDYSHKEVVFLDLSISHDSKGNLKTKIHSKACDTHAYLLPSSCHPVHICKNIPVGVMQRIKRNCSDPIDLQEAYSTYRKHLLDRNYSEGSIDYAMEKIAGKSRDDLLEKSEQGNNKRAGSCFPLVMKYNPRLPEMGKFIHKHKHILELTPETSNQFKDNIFVSFKMERNILSCITKNRFKPDVDSTESIDGQGSISCGKCTLCNNFLVVTDKIKSPTTNQTFKIKQTITCETKGVVYMINDKICPKIFYVGYSEDTMKIRWANHKSHIKKEQKSCELAVHMLNNSKDIHKINKLGTQAAYTEALRGHLEVTLIESVDPKPGQDLVAQLKVRENFWQAALKATVSLGGINKRTNRKHKK